MVCTQALDLKILDSNPARGQIQLMTGWGFIAQSKQCRPRSDATEHRENIVSVQGLHCLPLTQQYLDTLTDSRTNNFTIRMVKC